MIPGIDEPTNQLHPGAVAVSVVNVTKTYRSFGRRPLPVLLGVSLHVRSGEVVGLIGANGAGKTTLMSCLVGLLRAQGGGICIGGYKPDDLRVREKLGFVPERMVFERSLSGRQYLLYIGRLARLERGVRQRRSEQLLDRFGLTAAADRRLGKYSRGMLQRLAIAQALIAEPDFVFLDEPTSALDPEGVLLFRECVHEARARGAAVLINSHQLAEVERLCDRVYFMANGVAAEAAAPPPSGATLLLRFLPGPFDVARVTALGVRLYEGYATIAIATEEKLPALLRELLDAGMLITEVQPRLSRLEPLFRQ